RLCSRSPRQCGDHHRPRNHPDRWPCRRRHRLQPRQLRASGHAGRARCHGACVVEGSRDADAGAIAAEGHRLFHGQLSPAGRHQYSGDPPIQPNKHRLDADRLPQVDATIARVVGQRQIPISAPSTVEQGTTKLRVALVLDNTGSMNAFGKIAALKTAAHQFLQMMQAAARNPGDIQVAIVPFAVQVNVGAANINAPWIDWSRINGNSSWTGCVTDRDQPYDVQNTTPNPSIPATLFVPGSGWGSCPAPLMALNNDWIALNNKIDQMVAQGTTNQTIGLAWGWQALSAGSPLNAVMPSPDARQIIILLTDWNEHAKS